MLQEQEVLLSSTYLGPVQYYTKIITYRKALIEQHEHYPKQSYRNRCIIYGANGPVVLSIPVKKPAGSKTKTRDILLDYDTLWQNNHWRTIFSAYNSSPFFQFYEDDFRPFYEKKYKYLLDYNMYMQKTILDNLNIQVPEIQLTGNFIAEQTHPHDFRYLIHPKKNYRELDPSFHPVPYTQVFSEKHNFTANLSIIDLLFNEGPNAINILMESTG